MLLGENLPRQETRVKFRHLRYLKTIHAPLPEQEAFVTRSPSGERQRTRMASSARRPITGADGCGSMAARMGVRGHKLFPSPVVHHYAAQDL